MIIFYGVRCQVVYLLLIQIQSFIFSQLLRKDLPINEISECFNQTQKIITANCNLNYMIHLYEVYYGHSNMDICLPTKDDCMEKDNIKLECQGQTTCSINLPTGNYGKFLPLCGLNSNYIQMKYQCIPHTQIYDVCDEKTITSTSGYIITPNYPLNYPKNKNCTSRIVANLGQKLTLYGIDFDLETDNENGCSDLLYVLGTLKSTTLCGKRKHQRIFSTKNQHLSLQFRSDNKGDHKGFWLYFESDPVNLKNNTQHQTTTKSYYMTTNNPEMWRTNSQIYTTMEKNNTILPKQDKNTQNIPNTLYIVKLTGALLGCIFVILLIILVSLFIKRRKEENATKSSSQSNLKPLHLSNNSLTYPFIKNNLNDSGKLNTCVS